MKKRKKMYEGKRKEEVGRVTICILTIKAILLEQYENLEEQVEEEKLLDLEWQIERAMNALRCPPANSDVFPCFV
jgi:hypothetical protein